MISPRRVLFELPRGLQELLRPGRGGAPGRAVVVINIIMSYIPIIIMIITITITVIIIIIIIIIISIS